MTLALGSALASAGGQCLSLRDLPWAQWPLLLCFPCLGQLFQGFLPLLVCLFGLLCFGQESAWGVLVELLLDPLYSFLLSELLWVTLLLAGKVGFLLTEWFLGVTQSLLPPRRESLAGLSQLVPQVFQYHPEDVLSMPDPEEMAVPSALEWSVGKT